MLSLSIDRPNQEKIRTMNYSSQSEIYPFSRGRQDTENHSGRTQNALPSRRHSLKVAGKKCLLVDKSDLSRIRKLLPKRNPRCCICGRFLKRMSRGSRPSFCRDKCRKEYDRRRFRAYTREKASAGSLQGWHRDLLTALQTHTLPRDEVWLSQNDAKKCAGISGMQLIWLRIRGIVSVKRHPFKTWHGQNVCIYTSSEMYLIRKERGIS